MNRFVVVIIQMKKIIYDVCMNVLGAIVGGDKVFHSDGFSSELQIKRKSLNMRQEDSLAVLGEECHIVVV